MADRCPTCGQAVELHTGSEGTSCYVKAAEDSLRQVKRERDQHIERARDRECICSKLGDEWFTPPSCPFHGIKHLRDTNDHRIKRWPTAGQPQTVFDELDLARSLLVEAREALEEAIELVAAFEKGEWHDRGVDTDEGYMTTPDADRLREVLARLSSVTEGG